MNLNKSSGRNGSASRFPVHGLFLLILLAGCSPASKIGEVPEVQPGILQGYLAPADLPNSLIILPPPPIEESAAFELDLEMSRKTLEEMDSARREQASRDAILSFPEATEAFSGVIGLDITEEGTPYLYLIMRRVLTDAALSTLLAKRHYNRIRPFMLNGKPSCSPLDEEYLRKDGSYPSGHTAIGWAWALVLSEIFPEHATRIMSRGREFGESRIVCNVHWYSDVVAGRMIGAATVARLHADPVFIADLKKARKEVSGPGRSDH